MRAILGCLAAVVTLSFGLSADDKKDNKYEKIDAQKLAGKWLHEDDDKSRAVVEFTKDGKVAMALTFKGHTFKMQGTYKLEGSKIEMVIKDGDKERKESSSIVKLTDTELVMLNIGDGKEQVVFTRVKDK